ncbi:MAG TPA: SurA N-terminal domain-containing protein [Rhizomicrobium sp.]|nr:SurA N-terminal domain-containing protein [Rhizomicrobium sp.]
MLQELRKYTKSWYANVFLGLLTLSFVSWGAGSWFGASVDTSVAKVGGTPIDQNEFRRDYTNALRNAGDQRGKAISPEEAKKMDLGGQLLDQEITRTALDNVVRKLGLTASDAMVTAEIQRIPAFAGLTGQFDRQTFQQRIERIGYSEQGFIELVRADTARTQLLNAVQDGFLLPSGYAKAIFSFAMEMRAADYIVVDAKAVGAIPPPPDSVLEAYVKAHPNRYSTPEYRDVTYAWIAPQDVSAGITVTDDQIKQAYDNQIEKYVVPEKRDLQQLQFTSEADAKAASAKIKAGSSFDQVAAAHGDKPVALGDLVADDLDPSQSKVVFALKQGEASPPLKAATGNSWVLIKVVKITPGSTKTLDQAKDELRQAIIAELAQSKLTDVANAYTDASSSGLSLQEAAKKVGMHVAHVTAMDINGYAPDGTKTTAPDDPEFRKLVFRAEPGEEGDPQALKTGMYVISVNGAIPPKLRPLDQVRVQALADWTGEQRAILMKQKAQDLTAMVNRDQSIVGAAKSIGASVQQSPALQHGTDDDTFSAALVSALFKAKPGQAVYGPKGKSGDWVVARLTGILHPPVPENAPEFRAGVAQISQEAAGAITESYVAAEKSDQGVTYNHKLFNTIIGGETGEGS